MPEKFFFNKIKELSELYQDVKKKIILAEEVYDAAPFTLMNEVRASYDHVFRAFINNKETDRQELEKQIISASRHLKRAGYDACEFIVGGYVANIKVLLHEYSSNTLHTVLGEYYVNLKLFINDVESKYLVEARSDKNSETKIEDDVEIEELYPAFSKIIAEVSGHWEEVSKKEHLLRTHKDENQREKIYWFIGGIVVSIVLGALFFYFEIAEVFK